MKAKTLTAIAIFVAAIFSAGESSAYEGFVSKSVNLRAGPGVRYPVIATIRANRPVAINGCLERWDWCEVESGAVRGWVSGNYLEAVYEDRRGYIMEYGSMANVPVIVFELGSYWDEHYRDRPFYRERERYAPPPEPKRESRDIRREQRPDNRRLDFDRPHPR